MQDCAAQTPSLVFLFLEIPLNTVSIIAFYVEISGVA
jgi:hypothetical protein